MNKSTLMLLLKMQDKANSSLDHNWLDLSHNYLRAARVEAVEAMDPQYKWWKAGGEDVDNIKIELVDMFHFIMSEELRSTGMHVDNNDKDTLYDLSAENLLELNYTSRPVVGSSLYLFDRFIHSTYEFYEDAVSTFFDLYRRYGFSDSEFKKLYVSKNILNLFRWSNGYLDGTYQKIWNVDENKEDNYYVNSIIESLDASSDTYVDDLNSRITDEYTARTGIEGKLVDL